MTKLNNLSQALKTALQAVGFKEDRYGHYVKETVSKRLDEAGKPIPMLCRVKMQATSVRVEVKHVSGDFKEWVRVDGAYLKDVVVEADSVKIGRHVFK